MKQPKRQPYQENNGPHLQENRLLQERLFKMLLHPTFWDDRQLITLSPRDFHPGVVVSANRKFPHALARLRQFFKSQGFEVSSEAHHLIVTEAA